jgi:hypothetical protein
MPLKYTPHPTLPLAHAWLDFWETYDQKLAYMSLHGRLVAEIAPEFLSSNTGMFALKIKQISEFIIATLKERNFLESK